jgi:hypothetical protein
LKAHKLEILTQQMVGVELIVFENVKYFGIITVASICTCLKLINFVSVFFYVSKQNIIFGQDVVVSSLIWLQVFVLPGADLFN